MASEDSFVSLLERTRQGLLDLSLRNRLINTPRGLARSKRLDIVTELSDEVFRILVRENKSMSFLPNSAAEAETAKDNSSEESSTGTSETSIHLRQPDDDSKEGLAARQRDNQLQTRLSSSNLQDRLLGLYYDARTFEEEQGVSVLYLALGFLEWYETDSSDKPRFAPLILVPVELSRLSASSRFKLKFRDGELETNLSLQAKLRIEFGVDLPNIGENELTVPTRYFAEVEAAIQSKPRWKIHGDEIALWFFSFEKYLMYRDLDPSTWPEHSPLNENHSLRRLLVDGFEATSALCGDDDPLDAVIPPQQMIHVTDADSSQAVVIEEVRRGRNLVVQGPPGTGKSQTITNIIATAVQSGKKVLFVSEKMAALDVVKGRLDRVGLGAICLELHSHKANKKAVLEELNRTIELGRPKIHGDSNRDQQLATVRERLNRHATLMNSPLEFSGVSPYQVMGHLVACHADGVVASPIQLDHPERWPSVEFEERRTRLTEFENYLGEMTTITDHPWRGVRRIAPILPSELAQLLMRVRELGKKIAILVSQAETLCATLNVAVLSQPSVKSIRRLTELGRICLGHPTMDRKAISDPVWQVHPTKIRQLVDQGQRLTASKKIVDGIATDVAWATDLTEARHGLVSFGRCWFWFLYKDYWKGVTTLRGILKVPPPSNLDKQLAIIDALISGQAARRTLQDLGDSVGLTAFGSMWKREASDFDALRKIVEWEQSGREGLFEQSFRTVTQSLTERQPVEVAIAKTRNQLDIVDSEWKSISDQLRLEARTAFAAASDDEIPLSQITNRFAEWDTHSELLSIWIGYQSRRYLFEQNGLSTLIAAFEGGTIDRSQIVARYDQAYYESLLNHLMSKETELAAFHGPTHDQQINQFRDFDIQKMEDARSLVAMSHFSTIPRESGLGDMAVIRGEIVKKRMHRPIRQLLRDAGRAVQSIKPVFMMSPMSVARFLEPGVLEFDLLVMDEASQVTPEDALGAVARAKQIVVVGDSRQLPPSRFFSKLIEDENEEDGDLVMPTNLDSVLGLCLARGIPQRMLRWHYRSRHHSLIAVSNREFYDNQLCVIPSPTTAKTDLGLQFRHVPDGRFDRGATATNRREASIIADAVIEHAQSQPAKSLGVAAFSVAQRDAIRDELEVRLRIHPELDEFFSSSRHERFFVKNLENVQGDERDFIFISVGYAPDAAGTMNMNFGPLATDGGERRLNVLISRAKESCVVFSSITADQIDLQRARSRGAAALKTFLHFAATGTLETNSNSAEIPISEFERQVKRTLESAGIEVRSQVGTPGFAIDLAIIDPETPNKFLLGLEFDGITYANSRWARDRDRLRDSLLRDRGWQLHRIWCSDWFHRPDEQLERLLKAIDRAQTPKDIADDNPANSVDPIIIVAEIDREVSLIADVAIDQNATAYVEADIVVPLDMPIVDFPDEELKQIAVEVVKVEGPVHRQEVARRVLSFWKQIRLGPAIARKIDAVIDGALKTGQLVQDTDQFLTIPDQNALVARSRAQVTSAALRKPEFIPPSEVRVAIRSLVKDNGGITWDQLCSAATRMLGLKLVSPRLRTLIEEQLKHLIDDREIEDRDGKLYSTVRT